MREAKERAARQAKKTTTSKKGFDNRNHQRRQDAMSLSVTRLYTHWDAAEACIVIAFLDMLREQLMETYGDDIIEMRKQADSDAEHDSRQIVFSFDDDMPF
ncbi:MAG: hypothetical protein JRE56_08125 [Deltaproteobacteria bacterium]|jgi:hypothetical protein|nr:hypothetical protein [Deltaproteobacteria bacterium]